MANGINKYQYILYIVQYYVVSGRAGRGELYPVHMPLKESIKYTVSKKDVNIQKTGIDIGDHIPKIQFTKFDQIPIIDKLIQKKQFIPSVSCYKIS